MQASGRELWLALLAILIITAGYLVVAASSGAIPAAGELFGHLIGVVGFVLMLMTETLYSLRKRAYSARWGRMSSWLQFHIFTGLVGPYMVFLHSAFAFHGLAGVTMLMTIVVVASGVVGRYIYTAIPRTAGGIEMQADEVERAIAELESELRELMQTRPQVAAYFGEGPALAPEAGGGTLALSPMRRRPGWRWRRWRQRRQLGAQERPQVRQLERMLDRRQALVRQEHTLARARRSMAVWHAVHIPLGLALFTAAFVHAAAALYYATLLH
jgi:hypothetical protein